jgi:5-methylcytosine-specific restriction endonuclease McrA
MGQVLLLDSNFQPLALISLQKAVRLLVKEKVEVLKEAKKVLHGNMLFPEVVRLLKSIAHIYKREIPWNKGNTFIRDGYECQYCGVKLTAKTATVDHIKPVSKGGKNSWLNTTTSCKKCNNDKGDKWLHETTYKLRKQPTVPTIWNFIHAKLKGLDYDLASIWE